MAAFASRRGNRVRGISGRLAVIACHLGTTHVRLAIERSSICESLQGSLKARRGFLGHLQETHGVAEPGRTPDRFSFHPEPPLVWNLDLKDEFDAGGLFVQRVDEATSDAEIVDPHRCVEGIYPAAVEGTGHSVVLSTLVDRGSLRLASRIHHSDIIVL